MKKQIRNLTAEEISKLCSKYEKCRVCPYLLDFDSYHEHCLLLNEDFNNETVEVDDVPERESIDGKS